MKSIKVALIGWPNVGKTQLLNTLSGANLKVGNYSGVTVDIALASLTSGEYQIEFIDLPGVYSLDAHGRDEQVTRDFLENEEYDLILNVVDSTNLENNLFLTTELLELDRKMVVALNMSDESDSEGIKIDSHKLGELLGLVAVPTSSKTKKGCDKLLDRIIATHNYKKEESKLTYPDFIEVEIQNIEQFLANRWIASGIETMGDRRRVAINLLEMDQKTYQKLHEQPIWVELQQVVSSAVERIQVYAEETNMDMIFVDARHAFAKGALLEVQTKDVSTHKTITERIDAVLLNRFAGIPIFLFLMWGIFQLTFELGSIPMDWIDAGFAAFGDAVGAHIANDAARSLLVDGIIAGVGAVLLFLPNIIILFMGIALLESTGYMTRVAFLLDGFFHKFGMHGKSFIPLVTGFGCSVPAYMAARTLKNHKDRMITMFIIGFMSCGAKLPVYVLFAGAFFSKDVAGNVLFLIYISGAILGLIAAKFLRVFIFKGADEMFVMEMPKYRVPSLYLIWFTIWSKSVMYLKKAGTWILAASILIWFIGSYPVNETLAKEYTKKIEMSVDEEIRAQLSAELMQKQMQESYMGQIGGIIEPIFAPLGFDWKMSVATLSGLAAKEVIVSTLGVLYALGDEEDEESSSLREQLVKHVPFPSAVAFIVFVMVYLPCLAATAVFAKEAGSRKYVLYLALFTFTAAWILAFVANIVTTVMM